MVLLFIIKKRGYMMISGNFYVYFMCLVMYLGLDLGWYVVGFN